MSSNLVRRAKTIFIVLAVLGAVAAIAGGIYTAFWADLAPIPDKQKKQVISQQEERRLEHSLNSSDPAVQVLVIADAGEDHRRKFLEHKQPMLPEGTKVDVDPTIVAGNKYNRELRATVTIPGQKAVQYTLRLILEGNTWNIHYADDEVK